MVKKDPNSNIAYSKLVNQNNCCPFLSEDKLCNAYNLLGKENLSIGCSTYPREIKMFDNYYECAISGYETSIIVLNDLGRELVEEKEIYIKFSCSGHEFVW